MKLQGSLKDLVKVEGDKRDQLPPARSVELQQAPQTAVATRKTSNPGRPVTKEQGVIYVATRLQLPEELKLELDHLFLAHKKDLKEGKNQFLVEAVRKAIDDFKKKNGKVTA